MVVVEGGQDLILQHKSWDYHLRVSNVLKSGSLNLLEPSGPVQACNGIALPFYILICTVPFRTLIPLIVLSVVVVHFVPYFVPLYCFYFSSIVSLVLSIPASCLFYF